MKNLTFVLWVVLFPVSVQLADYLVYLTRGSLARTWSESTNLTAAILILAVWIWIGWLLYEPKTQMPGADE